jgi:ATP-dependent exoDNAse (exonuclease V) beta subunit
MGAGTLTIYNASAGSGKTFRLTGVYLERLFRLRWSYRRILAVTFTNKATAEMKHRILDELNNLATGGESGYLSDLESSTGKNEESIRHEAKEILRLVLHDYSRFYVSTIDSFFQKILRAFARDIGLHSGFNIEIDQSRILSAAVDKVIASSSSETTVRSWLTGFVRANIEDEKSWDLRKSILDLSEELFREKFKLLTPEEKIRLRDKDFLLSYIREIRAIIRL